MRESQVIHLASLVRDRAGERIREELDRLGHCDLAPSHGAVLALLYLHGPLPMHALARGVGRRKNTLTTLVRKLEEGGYVRRDADPADSRVTMVALTPKGEAFRDDFQAISQRLLNRIWGGMPPERRKELVAGLEELLANLG